MSRKHSRAVSMILGVLCGAILACILSFSVAFTGDGDRIANFFGYYEFGGGFFLLFLFVPASTLVGAITGGVVMALLYSARDKRNDN